VGEKDRFFGTLGGKQVEAELQRLGMLVKGLLRDLTSLKDSVWRLQEERYEVKQKIDSFEQSGLGELRATVESTHGQLQMLVGQVDLLDARVVAADDSSAQLSSLACKLELIDARLTACEEEDVGVWRSLCANGAEGALDGKIVPEALTSCYRSPVSSADQVALQASRDSTPMSSSAVLCSATPVILEDPAQKERGASTASTISGGRRPPSELFMHSRPASTPGRVTSEGRESLDKSDL
jgi:hypothetical protein